MLDVDLIKSFYTLMATRRNRPRKSKKYRGGGLLKRSTSFNHRGSYKSRSNARSSNGVIHPIIENHKREADRPTPARNSPPASNNWQHSRINPATLEQQLNFQRKAMNHQNMWKEVEKRERTELRPGLLQPNGSLATTMRVPEGMRTGVRPNGLRPLLNMS